MNKDKVFHIIAKIVFVVLIFCGCCLDTEDLYIDVVLVICIAVCTLYLSLYFHFIQN